MNSTRTGKIARLPQSVREQLNRRLQNGELGIHLVAWLNQLPEVRHILDDHFAGRPINPQNLSDWKHGGYREWLDHNDAQQIAREFARDAAKPAAEAPPSFVEMLALLVLTRYALTAQAVFAAQDNLDWRRLRVLCADVLRLRRSQHQGERLRLKQARLAFDRERLEFNRQCLTLPPPRHRAATDPGLLPMAEGARNPRALAPPFCPRLRIPHHACRASRRAPNPPQLRAGKLPCPASNNLTQLPVNKG